MQTYKTRKGGSAAIGPILLFVFVLIGAAFASSTEEQRSWFFFRDKGPAALNKTTLDQLQSSFTEKALARRAKVAGGGSLIQESDLPVYPAYLEELQELGIKPAVVSNWLNAVSAAATPEQIAAAGELTCIARIQPVLRGHRPLPQVTPLLQKPSQSSNKPVDYGYSLEQLTQIQIPAVHELGCYGQGVRIAVFDTGFRLQHEAFDSLRVIAKRDFIQEDDEVDNEEGDRGDQNSHGTMVLSIIAANKPGALVGGAPRAEFILAKTEDTSQEVIAEEDHWIAAAEWAERLGADIFTTSLGYTDWYTVEDMDGDTAPITRAADLAVSKGVVVLVAAGNEGGDFWRYISAPADGDSVLAVGAVDSKGIVAYFSSRGPAADGRIKPDIMAQGVSVACVSVPFPGQVGTMYSRVSGTSAACPLAASAAALILCANPALTPMQVVEAMRNTATRSQNPDTDYGWGIVQTLSALEATTPPDNPFWLPETSGLAGIYPNPAIMETDDGIGLVLRLRENTWVEARLYNTLGQEVGILYRGEAARSNNRWIWGRLPAERWRGLASGVYFVSIKSGLFNHTQAITLLRGGNRR